MSKFADRLKESRIEAGLSRSELAERLNVSVRTVSYWENGERECSFDMLLAAAGVLNVSTDYLLGKIDY